MVGSKPTPNPGTAQQPPMVYGYQHQNGVFGSISQTYNNPNPSTSNVNSNSLYGSSVMALFPSEDVLVGDASGCLKNNVACNSGALFYFIPNSPVLSTNTASDMAIPTLTSLTKNGQSIPGPNNMGAAVSGGGMHDIIVASNGGFKFNTIPSQNPYHGAISVYMNSPQQSAQPYYIYGQAFNGNTPDENTATPTKIYYIGKAIAAADTYVAASWTRSSSASFDPTTGNQYDTEVSPDCVHIWQYTNANTQPALDITTYKEMCDPDFNSAAPRRSGFGQAIAMTENFMAIGAFNAVSSSDATKSPGKVYFYDRPNFVDNGWTPIPAITLESPAITQAVPPLDEVPAPTNNPTKFGYSLAMSKPTGDGSQAGVCFTIAIGAPAAVSTPDTKGFSKGSVYIYTLLNLNGYKWKMTNNLPYQVISPIICFGEMIGNGPNLAMTMVQSKVLLAVGMPYDKSEAGSVAVYSTVSTDSTAQTWVTTPSATFPPSSPAPPSNPPSAPSDNGSTSGGSKTTVTIVVVVVVVLLAAGGGYWYYNRQKTASASAAAAATTGGDVKNPAHRI